jgi:N-acetylglutamate synthase-like GNAT family acetyltransferase
MMQLGAFCVDPAFRGSGRGDSLLDYVEQDARAKGVERLVLLTTRTADWFEQRDFKWTGASRPQLCNAHCVMRDAQCAHSMGLGVGCVCNA